MRISLIVAIALALGAPAVQAQPKRAPAMTELGTWDCNGSKTVEVLVPPGKSVYAWTGECSGAEGHSAIVEPTAKNVDVRQFDDPVGKRLILIIENRTGATVKRSLHVFVGFA